ncbi:MAG: nucleotidyltransferase family protein [Halocynthiibacter sp.]
MSAARIHILILAAGRSSRMGPQDKLSLPIGNHPLLTHVVQTALLVENAHVHVVLPHGDRSRTALVPEGATRHYAPLNARMGDVIAHGVTALKSQSDAILIALADMPDIMPMDYQALIDASRAHPQADAVRFQGPNGRFGHPTLLARSLFPTLTELSGDHGAKDILANPDLKLQILPVNTPRIHTDIDTPADFATWQTRNNPH